jgi:hypothetical protein
VSQSLHSVLAFSSLGARSSGECESAGRGKHCYSRHDGGSAFHKVNQ